MLPFPPGSILLAPMVGITNRAFRTLVDELGPPDWAFTEMASAEAFLANAANEETYTDPSPHPEACSVQFFARSAPALAEACSRLASRPQEKRPAGIDINFGCSAPHIRRMGGGSAWSSDKEGASALVAAARAAWPG
ncbi:MAG TPA: tRNA-dihydrouridine synthase, partial [Rectinemataceae bacterium]